MAAGGITEQGLRVWDFASGQVLFRLKLSNGHARALAFSADGRSLIVVSPPERQATSASYLPWTTVVRVLEVVTGQERYRFEVDGGATQGSGSLGGCPSDGRVLALSGGEGMFRVFDVATGKEMGKFQGHRGHVTALALSPDGKRLAAGGVDNRIRVWQISDSAKEGTNPLLYSVFAHEAPILRLAYSPNGRTIVSTGEDRAIKVWNAGKMTLRAELERQPEWCFGLDIAPDNKTLAVGRLDGVDAHGAAEEDHPRRLGAQHGELAGAGGAGDGGGLDDDLSVRRQRGAGRDDRADLVERHARYGWPRMVADRPSP
jgi:WD40 repeat protein